MGLTPVILTTDSLNAQGTSGTPPDPSTYSKAGNPGAGEYLYEALSGYGTNTTTNGLNKSYMTFKPSQLSTGTAVPDTHDLRDRPVRIGLRLFHRLPVGLRIRPIPRPPPGTMPTTQGYNPTFDLWSTGGYAAAGKA